MNDRNDDAGRRTVVKTGPIAAVEPVSAALPFVRPNPLLYPPSKRKPTPPSLDGLPFRPPSSQARDASAPQEGGTSTRSGDAVPACTDGPFEVATQVHVLRSPRHHLTVVAKLSGDLVDGAPATVREESALLEGDVFEEDEPEAPLQLAGDFAPIKEACDVLVYAEPLDDPKRPMALSVRGRQGTIERRVKTARELGPISPYDPGRVALLGTYDLEWYRKRWPHFADDLDVRYFQAAPGLQRLAGAAGDESFVISGFERDGEVATLRGRLPGVRAVALARYLDGRVEQVALRLDTISFFTGDARADLVWRGVIEVSDDDAPELEDVFVTMTGSDEEIANGEIVARYAAYRRRDEGEEAQPWHGEATGAAPNDVADAGDEAEGGEPSEPIEAANDEAAGDGERPPATSPEELAAMMREAGANEEDIADMLVALAPEQAEAELPPAPQVDVRAEVVRRLEAGEPLAGLELFSADLSELDLAGQDLTGLDLTGANLASANLSEATLDEADLSGARLSGANLTGASAKTALFCGADLGGARLSGADLEEADFTEAVLERARFDEANLKEARLYDVLAERAVFRKAVLLGARAEGARANQADFTEAVLDNSVWEKASLEGAKLESASLVDASLVRARCARASFARADLTDGRLSRAILTEASLARANLFEANLDRADLTRADLRASSLHGASTVGTILQGALLEGAITSYSRVGGRLP